MPRWLWPLGNLLHSPGSLHQIIIFEDKQYQHYTCQRQERAIHKTQRKVWRSAFRLRSWNTFLKRLEWPMALCGNGDQEKKKDCEEDNCQTQNHWCLRGRPKNFTSGSIVTREATFFLVLKKGHSFGIQGYGEEYQEVLPKPHFHPIPNHIWLFLRSRSRTGQ